MSINEKERTLDPLLQRWVWVLIPLALSLLPFGNAIREGSMVGAGPDVISSVWAMWWFQQEGISALLGQQSELANYPNGVHGSVLSPSSALLWALLEPLFGVGRALALVVWLQLGAFAWASGRAGDVSDALGDVSDALGE